MKIFRIRLFFLFNLALFVCILASIAIFANRHSKKMNRQVLEANKAQVEHIMDFFMNQQQADILTIVNDYTFWDELVRFTQTKDQLWSKDNLDPMIHNYALDGIWVYNLRQNRIYNQSREEYGVLLTQKIPPDVFSILERDRFLHYFELNQTRLMEIQAATIHASGDKEHKTKPEGYFFVCRIWNDDFIARLKKTVDAETGIQQHVTDTIPSGNTIVLVRPLPGIDGTPAAWFHIRKEYKILDDFRKETRLLIICFSLAVFLVILFIFLAYFYQVIKPSGLIKKTLDTQDATVARSISQFGGTYKEISKILQQFCEQQEKQRSETDEAKVVLLHKREVLREFSHMVRTPLSGLTGFSDLLSTPGLDESKRKLYADKVRKSSIELLKTIDRGLKEITGSDPGYYYSIQDKEVYPFTFQQALEKLNKRHPRLILVEDDPATVLFIQESLSGEGIQLEVFGNAISALEYLQKHKPSLILLDVQLPGMSGWDAAVQIKKILPDVPLIIQTAFATINDRERAASLGCDDYLAKPYTPDELFEVVLRNLPLD